MKYKCQKCGIGCMIIVTFFLLYIQQIECFAIKGDRGGEDGSGVVGEPIIMSDGRSLAEWKTTCGLSEKDYAVVKGLLDVAVEMMRQNRHHVHTGLNRTRGCVLDDIAYTPEEAQDLVDRLNSTLWKQHHHRAKRKFVNDGSAMKWGLPIWYSFDASDSLIAKAAIRKALQHWENNTCIRFLEMSNTLRNQHTQDSIMFTADRDVCFSFVGKTGRSREQMVNLGPSCISNTVDIGSCVHEIGHAIGFFHEQSRQDRDDYVTVELSNVREGKETNFAKKTDDPHGVPYDYGSIMHYGALSFSSTGLPTLLSKDLLYTNTMGQRVGLSFYDVKLANKVYCAGTCSHRKKIDCEHGGYVNPNNCNKCICPDGLAGERCTLVQTGCQGCQPKSRMIKLTTTNTGYLRSPNYPAGNYSNLQHCYWWIKAPSGCQIQLKFQGTKFGVKCLSDSSAQYPLCIHWVEIRYKNIDIRGPRFCCDKLPNVTMVTTHSEALVLFQSPANTTQGPVNTGFELAYRIDDPTCLRDEGNMSQISNLTEPAFVLPTIRYSEYGGITSLPSGWVAYPRSNNYGGNIQDAYISGDECVSLCRSNPLCMALDYNYDFGACYFHKALCKRMNFVEVSRVYHVKKSSCGDTNYPSGILVP